MSSLFIGILATIGAIFALIASIGIVRMPDFYTRLSVTIKAATLGMGSVLLSSAIFFNDLAVTSKIIAIIFFLILTAPIAGHIISRVAYFSGIPLWDNTKMDELKGKYDKKSIEKLQSSETEKEDVPK
jgi:multicomponent Na+:H+ antiporter subunit G